MTEITWSDDDALPFPLCISTEADTEHGTAALANVSLAFGNVLLVDHGRAMPTPESLGTMPESPAEAIANYPQRFAVGNKLGLMSRGKGDVYYTRLQWTDMADGTVNMLPAGSTGSILLRLVAKPSLLRTQVDTEMTKRGFLPPRPAPEPDFETTFFVTPAPSTYYGYSAAGAPGIGSDPS